MASRSHVSSGPKRVVAGNQRRRRAMKKSPSPLGMKLNPGINPPQITYQPWYSLTLVVSHTSSKSFTPSVIVSALRSQLDPHGHGLVPPGAFDSNKQPLPFRLQFRLHEVRTWNLTGRQVALAIDDYSVRNKSDQEQICGLVDTGTALHVPACGFRLPTSISNLVMRNDNDDKDDTLVHIIAPSGNSIMTYMDVTWRFDGPIQLVSPFQTDMYKLLVNQVKVKRTLDSAAGTLEAIRKVAVDSQPSFVERVVNGISKTAEVVAVAAGAEEIDLVNRLVVGLEALVNLCEDPRPLRSDSGGSEPPEWVDSCPTSPGS